MSHTDPARQPSFLEKVLEYIKTRCIVSSLALKVMGVAVGYGAITAVVPPAFTLWFWQVAATTVFLSAVGLFFWHETIGQAKALNPVYKFLYRLTGSQEYLNLVIPGKKTLVVPEEGVEDV